jgi:hypothetical protein
MTYNPPSTHGRFRDRPTRVLEVEVSMLLPYAIATSSVTFAALLRWPFYYFVVWRVATTNPDALAHLEGMHPRAIVHIKRREIRDTPQKN